MSRSPGHPERERALERGLQRAAAAERAAAVVHAREEALLKCVGDVIAVGEALAAGTAREQLEDGLAETVLEVLAPQQVAVGAQQPLAPGARHERDLLGGRTSLQPLPSGNRTSHQPLPSGSRTSHQPLPSGSRTSHQRLPSSGCTSFQPFPGLSGRRPVCRVGGGAIGARETPPGRR